MGVNACLGVQGYILIYLCTNEFNIHVNDVISVSCCFIDISVGYDADAYMAGALLPYIRSEVTYLLIVSAFTYLWNMPVHAVIKHISQTKPRGTSPSDHIH